MAFLILNSAQATAVRGASDRPTFAALQPRSLLDGTFIIGDEVLTDPWHISRRAALSALPTASLASIAAILSTMT